MPLRQIAAQRGEHAGGVCIGAFAFNPQVVQGGRGPVAGHFPCRCPGREKSNLALDFAMTEGDLRSIGSSKASRKTDREMRLIEAKAERILRGRQNRDSASSFEDCKAAPWGSAADLTARLAWLIARSQRMLLKQKSAVAVVHQHLRTNRS